MLRYTRPLACSAYDTYFPTGCTLLSNAEVLEELLLVRGHYVLRVIHVVFKADERRPPVQRLPGLILPLLDVQVVLVELFRVMKRYHVAST
jgi:hypothetical protein